MPPIAFGIVGSGWRAEFFLRIVRACPERFRLCGVVSRTPERRAEVERDWGVKAFASAEELSGRADPRFLIVSVPWKNNLEATLQVASLGIPILAETPPAHYIEGLVRLNEVAQSGARIQVAEQFHRQPQHAATIAVARRGTIGTVSQAQVSAGHGYHGISLIRRLLGVEFDNAQVSGFKFASPLVQGPDRDGPPKEEKIAPSMQQIVRFQFGDKLGILDFTGDQYFSWIRGKRVLVRGDRGEIVNNTVSYLKDWRTPIRLDFLRHETGIAGNLEGKHLQGIQFGDEWIYTNPVAPAPLPDEEIAIADMLLRMDRYVETGEEFYSLAEASQDQYLALVAGQAVESGTTILTGTMPWSRT